MSRILILYASHFGRTCAIAEQLAQRLRELEHWVDLVEAGDGAVVPPADYDAVIIGSRVELGRFSSAIVDYIREHRVTLMEMPTAFFSVSMAGSDQPQGRGCDPNGYNVTLFEKLAWTPTESAGFAGGLPYRRYNWFLRQIMKRISKSAGHTTDTTRDHVFTDDAAVAAFANQLATSLAFDASASRAP